MRTVYFEKNIPKILLTKFVRPIWPGVVFSGLAPTRMETLPDEPLPGPNWVRVRNLLCGICASDLHLLFVETEPTIAAAALPGTERIYLGHEVVGEITEIGADVTTLAVGERVIMDSRGTFNPTCVSREREELCRHCEAGNFALCESASSGGDCFGVGVALEKVQVDLMPVWYQEVDLIGTMAHGMEIWQGAPISTYDLVCKLLAEGQLRIDGLITHTFSLDTWRAAIDTALDKRKGAIKVVFDYRSDRDA